MGKIYVINERQYEPYKKLVFKYLDDMDWMLPRDSFYDDSTYISLRTQFPDYSFKSFTDYDDNEKPFRVLTVSEELFSEIKRFFKLSWEEVYLILKEWFINKTKEKIEEFDTF